MKRPLHFTVRDETNALTACAFRNGPLELHSGKYSALLEDASLSRVTNAEMKELMINASATLAKLLRRREDDPERYWDFVLRYHQRYCRRWNREDVVDKRSASTTSF